MAAEKASSNRTAKSNLSRNKQAISEDIKNIADTQQKINVTNVTIATLDLDISDLEQKIAKCCVARDHVCISHSLEKVSCMQQMERLHFIHEREYVNR